MKILVTGAKGQLGHDVIHELSKRKHEAVGLDIDDMDITDMNSVTHMIKTTKPDAVIHCAAWTAVDAAEDCIDQVRLVNATGTEYIATVCKELDIKMMYISTDYVFNGKGTHFWQADDLDRQPVNIYGQTKYEGELAIERILDKYFIVRIAWVFGVNGKNFIKTMLNLGKTRDRLTVVCDQVGSPTYTSDLAILLVDMIETDKYGRYHATNEGICSWYELACEIFSQAASMGHEEYDSAHLTVEPVSSDQYPTKAKRPANSRMSKDKLIENGFERLPIWQDAVKRYLHEIEF